MATPDQLIAAHQSATAQVRARVLAYISAVWSNSPAFRDTDVERIVARIVPVVQAGMLQIATLTNAYIGQQAVLAGVTWTSGVDRAIVNYRGAPPEVVYARPAKTVYKALSEGASYTDAVAQGLARLVSITSTDMQSAKTRQAQASIGGSGFKYFRRVLTGAENCALCAIASTQRYNRGDLMPIHPACDCGVAPLATSKDPGQVIDAATLELIHNEVEQVTGTVDRSGRAPDYRQLVVSNMHGELGPTLGWRDHKFTGPAQLR